MKPTFTPARSGIMRITLSALAATHLAAGFARAQSAEAFDTSGIVASPAPAPAAAPAPAPAVAKTNAEMGPSRYAGSGPELAAYVERFASTMSIRKRATDPFGRYQDPDFRAPEPQIINSKKTPSFKKEPPVPFADVVAAIQVSMIIPARQSFLVSTPSGARTMKQGNVFPIQLPNGKKIKVKVKSVTATSILFTNLDTGESATLKPGVMPPGMQRGTAGITAPGMQPDGPNAPLEIQAIAPISSNR